MPFDGEFAGYEPLRRILSNDSIRAIEDQLVSLDIDALKEYDISRYQIPLSDNISELPKYIISIDGSYHAQAIHNGFPGAEIGYITVSSILILFEKLKDFTRSDFINPREYRETQKSSSLDTIVAGCNVTLKGEKSAKASMRKMLYEGMAAFKVFETSETLLETYEYLLKMKMDSGFSRVPRSPTDVSKNMKYGFGVFDCPHSGEKLYSTDALRLHELFSESDTSGGMYGQVMSMLEKVTLVHILRAFEKEGYWELLQNTLFILDGPLACFSTWSWMHGPLKKELTRLCKVNKKEAGDDLLIIGIEKTGTFVNHFELLDIHKTGSKHKINPRTLIAPDDDYIKQNIVYSDSTKPYGYETYFGNKLFYKTLENYKLVVNIVDFDFIDASIYSKLTHALDNLTSNLYPNSIMPLTVAHSEASIPLNLGKKIFEKIAEQIANQQ